MHTEIYFSVKGNCPIYRMTIAINPAILTMEELLFFVQTRRIGEDKDQIEASLKYGSHGGAHGHYDRCALNAVSRNGRSLFNPEKVWYAYGTYMYKFFVQTSLTHNMVTTDLKMQDPSEAKRILFHSGKLFQATAIENYAKWSNPPYGGWRVLNGEKRLCRAYMGRRTLFANS